MPATEAVVRFKAKVTKLHAFKILGKKWTVVAALVLTLLADCGPSLEADRPCAVLGRRAELARRLEESLILGLKVHCASASSTWLRFSSAYLQTQNSAVMQPRSMPNHGCSMRH